MLKPFSILLLLFLFSCSTVPPTETQSIVKEGEKETYYHSKRDAGHHASQYLKASPNTFPKKNLTTKAKEQTKARKHFELKKNASHSFVPEINNKITNKEKLRRDPDLGPG